MRSTNMTMKSNKTWNTPNTKYCSHKTWVWCAPHTHINEKYSFIIIHNIKA
jgi:hypothetical protein